MRTVNKGGGNELPVDPSDTGYAPGGAGAHPGTLDVIIPMDPESILPK
jgi:hypothetical protein